MITALKLLKNLGKTPAKFNVLIAEEPPAPRPASTQRYSSDIEMIHHEFEVASDKLLEEANIVLEEAKKADVNKVSRLKLLGFNQSQQVINTEPLLEKAKLSEEQIKLISYYKENYPFNKFITEEQVKEICHKYNLVCGDVDRFKGFVPEKNLREIERFKLKTEDTISYIVRGLKGTFYINVSDLRDGIISYLDTARVTYVEFVNPNIINVKGGDAKYGKFAEVFKQSPKLQICAPIKDMDTSGLEIIDGYKLIKKYIPDPVVLQPVRGGYLILTAWGDEASDPIVVNEINN